MIIVKNESLQRRLLRVARILNRVQVWERLARDNAGPELLREDNDIEGKVDEVGELLLDELEEETGEDHAAETKEDNSCGIDDEYCSMEDVGMDDGTYPAGPRKDVNHPRYKVEPGHNQSVVDFLRFTP